MSPESTAATSVATSHGHLPDTGEAGINPEALDLIVEFAHDLRSPLTSILFLAEALQQGHSGPVNAIQRRQLGIIYSAALGLASVATDMVELARGAGQLSETELSAFSVSEVFASIRDIVRPLAEEKNLDLRWFPPKPDQRLGYPVALSRVLINLTTNALKFTEEGHIEVTATPIGTNRIEFSVRDTGPGLDIEDLGKLFQPFRPGNGRKRYDFSGSGLGLMISRRLIEAMGSELQVETRKGWGTRFHFEVGAMAV